MNRTFPGPISAKLVGCEDSSRPETQKEGLQLSYVTSGVIYFQTNQQTWEKVVSLQHPKRTQEVVSYLVSLHRQLFWMHCQDQLDEPLVALHIGMAHLWQD